MAKQMNYKKGFIIPLLVALVAVLAIGGGYYYVKNTKKVEGIYPITLHPQSSAMTETLTVVSVQPVILGAK
jgi:hypothetical protein